MPNTVHVIAPRDTVRPRPAGKYGPLYPLDLSYKRSGVDAPTAKVISASAIPLPYRKLLDHQHSMTATLEQHYGVEVTLRPLFVWARGRWYFRRVVLTREDTGRPLEMGAIHMNLEALRPRVRTQIVRHQTPIGRVLDNGSVRYCSRPVRFLSITPNFEMMALFWMRERRNLYGRQTELTVDGRPTGTIVEILPLV